MTMDPDTLLLTICGPQTGRVPVLDSPCVVGVLHSHAVGLRGAPYQTQQHGHMARNHSPCTVLSAHTGRAASCSVSARIAQRRVELAAARLLPSSESPTLPEDSLRTAGAARTLWTGTSPMRPHTPGTRAPAPQTSQGPDTPWRPTCGSGQSPDAARAPSRHFTQEKREARSCNSKSGRPVAATVTHEAGEKVSQKIVLHPPAPPSSTPPYVWRISHAKWNLLRKIDSSGEGTSRRWLVGEWGGVRWAAALPGAAGASVCPPSEAEPSGGANRLVVRRRKIDP